MKIDLSRFVDRFKIETRDNLVAFDNALIEFEHSLNASGEVFDSSTAELTRIAHAIKGAARMLAFNGINSLCHSLEELVISIRVKGEASPEIIDLIVGARHGIENLLSLPSSATDEKGEPLTWLVDLQSRLRDAAEGKPVTETNVEKEKGETPKTAEKKQKTQPVQGKDKKTEHESKWRDSTVRVDVETIDDILLFGRELSQALGGLNMIQKSIDSTKSKLEARIKRSVESHWKTRLSVFEDMEIERELNEISLRLKEGVAEVERHVRQIDSDAVELRMRHIEELYEKVPIQVRDLSRRLKKGVSVAVSGGNVRLDGRIIDRLGESMLHLIRNSIDHGIESPEERDRNGKSEEGKLFISASENSGWVKIVIADDGRGIDPEVIRKRLVEMELIGESDVENLTDDECLQYIFNDRFSTRKNASDISGRGVGLSAVKERLRELRGECLSRI